MMGIFVLPSVGIWWLVSGDKYSQTVPFELELYSCPNNMHGSKISHYSLHILPPSYQLECLCAMAQRFSPYVCYPRCKPSQIMWMSTIIQMPFYGLVYVIPMELKVEILILVLSRPAPQLLVFWLHHSPLEGLYGQSDGQKNRDSSWWSKLLVGTHFTLQAESKISTSRTYELGKIIGLSSTIFLDGRTNPLMSSWNECCH